MEEPPNLELKPLPETLKYAYLGEDEKLPIVIASNLSKNQEESLFVCIEGEQGSYRVDNGWYKRDKSNHRPALDSPNWKC